MTEFESQPGTNVLVLAPSLSSEKHETCLDLLAAGSRPTLDVLYISYSASPVELVEQWQDTHGELPGRMGIVTVGTQAGPGSDSMDELSDSVFVTTANPNDITGLGMRLNNYLNDTPSGSQLAVCFDSLTELLQFADVRAAFKFLHMFTGQLRETDAVGHFHLDPGAHERQTISRLKPVFDDAIDCT